MKPFLLIIFAALLASGSVPASADEPPAHVITPPESTAPAERPLRVGLVLSGGGARGFAHIGVLKVLEEAGVKVSVITATSMGSMVGGAYAEGYTPEEMANIVKNVNWTQMFAAKPNRADLNWRRKEDKEQGLSDTELGIGPKGFALPYGIVTTQELDLFLAKTNEPASMINDLAKLPIPFAAFATDLETGKAVELQKNISLSRAMRASMSIPGVYAPAEWQGKLLVDGGLVQNLPVDAARAMGADIIIAVNVGTPLSPRKDLGSIAGVMGQMLNILTEQNVQKSLKELRKEDILITPDLSKYTSGDFTKSAEIMKVGEDAARKIFDQLKKLGVPQKEFAAWNAKRHELIETDKPHQLADIRVDGLKTVNPKSVLAEIKIRPGDTVTTSQVEAADKKIWQDDDFLSVPYRFEPGPDGMEVLVFEPQEKTWGYSSFRFGGRVQTNFDDDNNFQFMLQHTLGWLNSWGGELRTEAQIGKKVSFSMQLYQPIGTASPFYLLPRIYANKESYDLYNGDNRSSSWQNKTAAASLELGYEIGRLGTISAGTGYFTLRNTRTVGNDKLPVPNQSSLGSFINLSLDRLDNVNFPTKGYKLDATGMHFYHDMGTSRSRDTFDASGTAVKTFGPWTVNASLKGGRSSLEGVFKLGGAFNLSGSGYGRYSGDRMQFGRLMVYRSLSSKLMQIGAPVWAGVSLEAGKVYNSSGSQNSGWKQAYGLFLGADTWIGPIYLVVGKTSGGSKAIYFAWGHIQ